MRGNSWSMLDISRFCGQAAKLSKAHGAGRAAAMSKARHAAMAGELDAKELALSLTPEEIEQIQGWRAPDPFEVGSVTFRYEDALKEWQAGLNSRLEWCPYGDPEAVTRGIADMLWSANVDGTPTLILGDAKRSRFTSRPDSLQLVAGALAAGSRFKVDKIHLGIWVLEDSEWIWAEPFDLRDMDAAQYAQWIRHAAQNHGSYSTGPHCDGCFSRLYCPEYLYPPEMAHSELKMFAQGWEPSSQDEVVELLMKAERAKKTAESVIDNCRAWAREHGGKLQAGEKVYRPVNMGGRETVSLKVLRETFGDKVDPLVKRGAPYQQWRWSKAK